MAIDKHVVVERIAETCDNLGQIELAGIKLENADPRLLDVSQLSFDKHVAMQPAAIAYFGVLRKEASRRLATYKRACDRWEKKQYALAKAAYASGAAKATVADVEARFVIDNEKEIEQREAQTEALQRECDILDEWYEAWKQKSYSIREFADIEADELRQSASMTRSDSGTVDKQTRLDNVRRIIAARNQQG